MSFLDNAPTASALGLGASHLPDPFQAGREAAQTARRQLPEGPLLAAFLFAPAGPGFKEFVEGVRLVCGADRLIAVPVSHLVVDGAEVPGGTVALFQNGQAHVSLSAADMISPGEAARAATKLYSDFRRQRGGIFHQFERGTILLFGNDPTLAAATAAQLIENFPHEWAMCALFPRLETPAPLAASSIVVRQGLIGLEWLGDAPWGVAGVNTSPFPAKSGLITQAVKAAVRDALSQMTGPAAMAIASVSPALMEAVRREHKELFKETNDLLKGAPLAVIPCEHTLSRGAGRTMTLHEEPVTVVAVPA